MSMNSMERGIDFVSYAANKIGDDSLNKDVNDFRNYLTARAENVDPRYADLDDCIQQKWRQG